jgi:transcriptional regulator with XRE-family HTH domain
MEEKDTIWLGKFAAHLAGLMEAKGMSQRRLATMSGISLGKINKVVHAKANLTLTTLRKLAEGLDLPPSKLLDFESE